MTPLPDHYAALGIDPTADPEVITAAYRALAKKFHPDTGGTAGTASPERFEQVQNAYDVLRTPETRHQYDLELLAQTERELAEHLATRSRIVPKPEAPRGAPPPPDLGTIRPAPGRNGGAYVQGTARKPRSILPYLVPVLLLLALGGGGAVLFLPKTVEAPPAPTATATAPEATTTPAKTDAPATLPAAAPEAVPAQPPLFGSSVTEAQPAPVPQPSPSPAPAPAAVPAPAPSPSPATQPLFGSSVMDAAAAAAAAPPVEEEASADPPPVPKLRPVQASAPPRPAAAVRAPANARPPTQPPRQPQRLAAEGPYRLVIFERLPGEDASAWRAGVIFDSEGSCAEFGIRSVLRRLSVRDPYEPEPKVWYECQPAGMP
ncbi:J domain-containing protein [Aestuariivirga sp.]|uniref:J domain-containing protein n=1 Tax=Aestuariivirga sp. TaxID=2650926 RepID=UPI003BAAB839